MTHPTKRRSAVLLLTLALGALDATVAHAAGVSPAKATPVQREQAQARFMKGRSLYTTKKYDAALEELNASLDIVASPNTRLYIGRALRDMGRTVAAYVELGRAAVEAKELVQDDPRYEQTAESARQERAQLEPKLAFVEVQVTHPGAETTLRVGGDEVRRGGWAEPVPVKPGSVDVAVETPGHAPVMQTIDIRAGERKQVAIDAAAEAPAPAPAPALEPRIEPSATPLRPLAFASAGVAVAGLATFLVAGAMANGTYSDLERACGGGPCPPGHAGDVSAGKTQQTLANVGLGVFAVFGAASATLFVLDHKKASAAETTTGPTAKVGVGPSFLTVRGTF
jgi:hypothetical protein